MRCARFSRGAAEGDIGRCRGDMGREREIRAVLARGGGHADELEPRPRRAGHVKRPEVVQHGVRLDTAPAGEQADLGRDRGRGKGRG